MVFLSVSQPQVEPLAVIWNNTTPRLRATVDWVGKRLPLTSKPAMSESFEGIDYMKKSCGAGIVISKLTAMRISSPTLKSGSRTYY